MPILLKKLPGRAFLAYPEKLPFLLSEISQRFSIDVSRIESDSSSCTEQSIDILPSTTEPMLFGNLVYIPAWSSKYNPYWASCSLESPFTLMFGSIKEASSALRDVQRNWASYQYANFRRASLIGDALPYMNRKKKVFPFQVPQSSVGLYTLLGPKLMICSAITSTYLPAGALELEEDHENPPSRAYLKLQEALVRLYSEKGVLPKKGDRCFDAGACPGGWTWVLRQLDCTVVAVDRSELSPALMSDPNVEFIKHDAFTLSMEELGNFDWIFSDVICYPERLLSWVKAWIESGRVVNMICTLKLQGNQKWSIIEEFASIPGSSVVHLCYNKHELTWIYTS